MHEYILESGTWDNVSTSLCCEDVGDMRTYVLFAQT